MKFHIRFNTKCAQDSDLKWRIFQDTTERLASDFLILTPVYGEKTIEDGVEKMNVACEGNATWVGTHVTIQ